MSSAEDIDEDAIPSLEVNPTSIQEDQSPVPAAIEEDRKLLEVLESEIQRRRERYQAAKASVEQKRSTLWQAETRQETAKGLYSLSKNMMDQIRREGQLTSPQRGPRDEKSKHGRSLSSMDQSRKALVDRTITTLKDSIAELQAASSDVTIAQRNVDTAEDYLDYCIRSLNALSHHYRVTKNIIDEDLAALRPTPKLPDDVWRRIFAAVVASETQYPPEPQDVWDEWPYLSMAITLSQVNATWRRIATSTPSLWSGVQIVYTKEQKLRLDLLQRIIGLATGAPITIVITLTHELADGLGSLAQAFTEDHLVRHIRCQVTETAAPSLRTLLDALPPAQFMSFKGLEGPMPPTATPVKLPSKHVLGARSITVSNLLLERLPPFFIVPPPPWGVQTLCTDLPSLLRIDIGGTAPQLQTIIIYQPQKAEQGPPWYDSVAGFNVENVVATKLIIHSMSRGHMSPLLRYMARIRYISRLELYNASVQPVITSLKENLDGSHRFWLPALTELVIHEYEQHGSSLGLYIAARLDVSQRSVTGEGAKVQPITRVEFVACSNLSTEITDLIEQHCVAGRKMLLALEEENGGVPQSA
ncbi:hypothetical protein CPB86DRAFT_758631 [Serendipita vermifera]|nr:hypothetical protein CPB86DRAFT_758631 [Serendipita vermifera]